ncbi:MAG: metallophosphoesterase family protein [Wujia sp.]
MKFIHLTDTHIRKDYGNDAMGAVLGKLQNPVSNLKKILAGINWNDTDFVIITGDLVHEGTTEDYVFLKETVEAYVPDGKKVLYALGNHDEKNAFYEAFQGKEDDKPYYYMENIDGYRIIVLDSAIPKTEAGTLTNEQCDWLKEILAEQSEKGSLVFLHHPVFWGGGQSFGMELTNGAQVLEILRDSDVIAVFAGHTHSNGVNTKEGISQYVADSMAFSIEMRGENIAFTEYAGYETVEVTGQDVTIHTATTYEAPAAAELPIEELIKQLKSLTK